MIVTSSVRPTSLLLPQTSKQVAFFLMAPTVLLLLFGTVSVSASLVVQASGPRPERVLSPEFQALIDTCERALAKYQTSTEMVPKDLNALWASALQRNDSEALVLITMVKVNIMQAKVYADSIKGVQDKLRQHKYPDTSFKSLYRSLHDDTNQLSTILQRIDKFVEDWPKTYDNSNVSTNVDPNGKVKPDTNVNTNGNVNSNNNINSNTNVNSNIEVNSNTNTNTNTNSNVKPNTNVNSNIEVNSNTNVNPNLNPNTNSNIKPNLTNSAGKYCFKCIKVSAAITGLAALGILIGKAIGGSFDDGQDHGDNTGSLADLVTSSSTLSPTVGVTTLEPSAFGPIIIIGGIVLIVLLIAVVYFLVRKRESSSGHDPETGKSAQDSSSGPSSIDDSKVNKSKAEKSKAYSNKRGQSSSSGAKDTSTTGTSMTTLSGRTQESKGV